MSGNQGIETSVSEKLEKGWGGTHVSYQGRQTKKLGIENFKVGEGVDTMEDTMRVILILKWWKLNIKYH